MLDCVSILKSPGAYFSLFGLFDVRIYTFLLCLGYAAGWLFAMVRAWRWGYDVKLVGLGTLAVLLGGELGARLYYVAICWGYYSQHVQEIFDPRQTGLAIHGVILGVIFAVWIYCRCRRVPVWQHLDLTIAVVPLAQCIWRLGNFFNNEAFGLPIAPGDAALVKLFIPLEFRPQAYASYSYFHPAFLYEAIWDLAAFVYLYFVASRKFRHQSGVVTCLFLVQYGLCRLLIEPIRIDGIAYGGINVPIVASLVCLVAGSCLLVLRLRSHDKEQIVIE